MITSSGAKCDVCGEYILPIGDEMVNILSLDGANRRLHCHNKCRVLAEATEKWEDLPAGPLRKAFEEQEAAEYIHHAETGDRAGGGDDEERIGDGRNSTDG